MKYSTTKSTIVLPLVVFGMPAAYGHAQTDDPRVIDEVIVSATKRDTLLQDTPIAVSVFDETMLEKNALTEVSELASVTPNLSMGVDNTSNALEVSLRGISSNNNTEFGNPAVSVNIDGIYIPRPQGANALFYDVQRVEVLRGPQGTLFGRNSTAGAINVVTNRPSDEVEGHVQFTAGNYGRLAARAMVNVPVSDALALRGSLQFDERDGYFDNSSSAANVTKDFGAADQLAGRISALLKPNENFSWLLSYDVFNDKGTPGLSVPNPLPAGESVFDRAVSDEGDLDVKFETLRSRIEWDLTPGLRAVYLFGYGQLDRSQKSDLDGGVSTRNYRSFSDFSNEFYSHDVQLQSTDSGPFEWTVGAFYFEEKNDVNFAVQIPHINAALSFNHRDRGQKAIAGYGQGTYNLSDRLRVTGGIRYTEDTKTDVDPNNYFCPGQGVVDITGIDLGSCIRTAGTPREEKFDAVTWRAGLDWDATDSIMLYASTATGFKSGGFNSFHPPFDEEKVLTMETGMKGTFLDGSLRLNAAAFHSSYDDLQLSSVEGDPPSLTTRNAAEATIKGLELEGIWLIGENTQIDGFVSWLDAEIDSFPNAKDPAGIAAPSPVLDISGNKLPRSPNWSFTISSEHRFHMGALGTLTPRLTFHWEDDSYLREFNRSDVDLQEAWTKTDLTVTYAPNEGNWSLQAYTKNLEDDAIIQKSVIGPPPVGSPVTTSYSAPRTYGVIASYRW